jgi:hypothetical protein
MASRVQVANRALQKCGISKRLNEYDEDTQQGRAIRACYEMLVETELQRNLWTFATARVQLGADTETPVFDYTFQFQLPADFLRLAPRFPKESTLRDDWQIEGRKILSNDGGPLDVRYVRSGIDEEQWHPLFREGIAARVAHEIIMELKASQAKKDQLATEYVKFMADARRANAIEHGPIQSAIDQWETTRLVGTGQGRLVTPGIAS